MAARRLPLRHEAWLGHPACSRFVQGLSSTAAGRSPAFHPLFRPDDSRDAAVVHAGWRALAISRPGSTRGARPWHACAGLHRAGPLVRRREAPFSSAGPAASIPKHPARFVWRWLRGRARVSYLNIVSHHFMSRAEMATPLGQERLGCASSRCRSDERLVSMCEVNALGVRDHYYGQFLKPDRRSESAG